MPYSRLAVILLFALTVGDPSQKDQRPNLSKDNSQNDASKSVTFVNNETTTPQKESAQQESPHWYTAPEWWLCIIGVPTLIFVGWQAKETRKAAEATLLNAQALINSERPWLMVRVVRKDREHQKPVFSIVVVNHGRSPAHILAVFGPKQTYCEKPSKLPLPPEFGDKDSSQRFIGPSCESTPLLTVDPWSDRLKMTRGIAETSTGVYWEKLVLIVFGCIEYSDGVSDKSYTTVFCYRHDQEFLQSGGTLEMCGPKEYNRYT
jgi:hypothetical protein